MEFPEYVRHPYVNMQGAVEVIHLRQARFEVTWEDGTTTTERLSGEGESWIRMLDRATVDKCLELVKAWDRPYMDDAKVYVPGFHSDGWVIALEGGMEDWPIKISEPGAVQWPDGVGVEPLNHWAVSLFST